MEDWWNEYDCTAEWCAQRGLSGAQCEPLPDKLSQEVKEEIDCHREEFQERVRAFKYALEMNKIEAFNE